MGVAYLKMSENGSEMSIRWLYNRDFTFGQHFQALQANMDILIPKYQVDFLDFRYWKHEKCESGVAKNA